MTKPRIAVYKNSWKVHQNTEHWCDLTVALSTGLQFDQTRSNAIILYNICDVYRESGCHEVRKGIVQQNVSISYCTARSCAEAELEL